MWIIVLKNYSFKELKKIASIQETSFSLLERPSSQGLSRDWEAEQH